MSFHHTMPCTRQAVAKSEWQMTTHALENLCQQAVDEAEQWREAAEVVGPEQLEQAREEAFQVLC